eukprot:jgi/Mesvir1/29477/Mv25115-RA.1
MRLQEQPRLRACLSATIAIWTLLLPGAAVGLFAPDQACMAAAAGRTPLNRQACAADTLQLSSLADVTILDDGCSAPNDNVSFSASWVVTWTTQEALFDMGLWVSQDRDLNGDRSSTGKCHVVSLPTSGVGIDLDGDVCGEIPSTQASQLSIPPAEAGPVTVHCLRDGNYLSVPVCVSWSSAAAQGACGGVLDTFPRPATQCWCGRLTVTDVLVPPCRSNADCDDGLYCNGPETCDSNGNCQPGIPPSCDDNVACTDDTCAEDTDSCAHTPQNWRCQDGSFCNGRELCDPVAGCQAGAPADCDDGVSCTVDACDDSLGGCVNTPDHAQCDNGLFCDGRETCDPTAGCLAGAPPSCEDGVACTVDSCDELRDSCLHVADDLHCRDGVFCNGQETCDPEAGCLPGATISCDDGVACTFDSCDEPADACVNAPNSKFCDDGQFCNGPEVCNPFAGCQPGTPPDCSDGISCTDDSCDESADLCVNAPDDFQCDDGLFFVMGGRRVMSFSGAGMARTRIAGTGFGARRTIATRSRTAVTTHSSSAAAAH